MEVFLEVYQSFYDYKSGIYHKGIHDMFPVGGHAVKLIGWGTQDGDDYWICANSWGTEWGE